MKTKKPLLAISGKRFSGKDTFASLLVTQFERVQPGRHLHTHAFARESKRLFVAKERERAIEVDLDRLQSDRDYKESWRPKLTAFTEASLAADPLVFCRSVADRIEAEPEPSLITDVRLRLEVEHLRPRFDLHLVRIARSDEARARSGWSYKESVDGHHTETELDDPTLWDEVVTNDGTLEDLATKAAAIIAAWCARSPR